MINDTQTVFVAEFLRRIKSRPFIIGVLIGVVSLMALSRLPAILERAFGGSSNIIVVGEPQVTAPAMRLLKSQYHIEAELTPREITSETLKEYDAAAALLVTKDKSGLHVTVLAHDPGSMGPREIRRALLPLQLSLVTGESARQIEGVTNFPIDVRPVASKFTSADQAEMVRNVAYTLIFFLYLLILINSQLITSSVAEEKTSRIAELLVASVDPVALLSGKILAGAVLAVLQMVVWIGAAMLSGPSGSASSTAGG
ncbi:MAG TPA: ABC transporter permease, partial [Candidatus Aquilonibacter sp.]|nr:ABC transporter permease [Candidatus Aquilonibacter sp.]